MHRFVLFALVAAWLAAGCNVVAPFHAGAPADVSTPSGDGVQPVADSRDGGDVAISDGVIGDGIPVVVDGSQCPPKASDLAPAVADCTCAPTTPNNDCDGLVTKLEPQPSTCNKLAFEDPLAAAAPNGWTFYGKGWRWSCGSLQQTDASVLAGGESFNWAYAKTVIPRTDLIIEARITLGAINDPREWAVGVVARVGSQRDNNGAPDKLIGCSLRVDADRRYDTYFGIDKFGIDEPDLKVDTKNGTAWDAGWPTDNPHVIDAAPGDTVLLELWYKETPYNERQIRCHAMTEGSAVGRGAWYQIAGWNGTDPDQPNAQDAYVPIEPGSVGLRTRNRQATFDYVRVYAAPGI